MSARLLRRVLQEQEEQHQKSLHPETDPEDEDEDEDDDSASPNLRSPFQNPFDLLEDQDLELEEPEEASTGKNAEQELPLVKNFSEVVATRKSKKKKKRGKDSSSTKSKVVEAEESLDQILESLSIEASHHTGLGETKSTTCSKGHENFVLHGTPSVLAVDPKFLREENELRRIFGSKVVSSFENSSSSSSRPMPGGRRGTRNPRKTILVSPSGYWPRWDGSLSMELLETKDGKQFFRYVHSSTYIQAQRAFEAAKAIHDINGIASILAYYPYHIESLLTISEMLRFSGEHQSSADYIAKCLYALECAWHPSFTPLHGNCQLKYSHDTNKPLFSSLFSHMQNMERRGCHRSALEICKLLLSLDSDDPMGTLFCIDYFALRAEEYTWLERFAEEYRCDSSLWLFPNFSYSLAVSRFYLEKDCLSKTDKATSTDLMKQALMLHPLVLKKLVAKAPLKEAVWTKILKHVFFGSAKAGSPSLDHLISIYVERNYLLWRFPELQKLLKEAAQLVIDTLNLNGSEAKDWDCVRKEAFSSEKNEYSHLLVSDFSDSVPSMPPDELRNMMVDPRVAEAVQNGGAEAARNGGEQLVLIPEEGDGPLLDLRHRNPLMLLLEGLIVPLANMGVNGNANLVSDQGEENGENLGRGGDANRLNGHEGGTIDNIEAVRDAYQPSTHHEDRGYNLGTVGDAASCHQDDRRENLGPTEDNNQLGDNRGNLGAVTDVGQLDVHEKNNISNSEAVREAEQPDGHEKDTRE